MNYFTLGFIKEIEIMYHYKEYKPSVFYICPSFEECVDMAIEVYDDLSDSNVDFEKEENITVIIKVLEDKQTVFPGSPMCYPITLLKFKQWLKNTNTI